MYFTKAITLVALLATGVLAAPAPGGSGSWGGSGGNPPPPPPPPPPSTSNTCSKGSTAYCCDGDSSFGLLNACKVLDLGSNCGGTVNCCDADQSIQLCLGSVTIL